MAARSVLGVLVPLAFIAVFPVALGLAIFQPAWLLLIPAALLIFGVHTVVKRNAQSKRAADL